MSDDSSQPDATAVLPRRVVGHLIDAAVYAAAFLIPVALLRETIPVGELGEVPDRLGRLDGGEFYTYQGDSAYVVTESDLLTAGLITLGVYLLLGVVLQGLTGRTAGKFVVGVRAVRADGSRPGILRAFVRELFWIVDGIPSWVFALVGGIVALFTTGRRRVGDLVAGTYVVKRDFAGQPVVPAGDTEAGAAPEETDEQPEAAAVETTAVAAGVDTAVGDDRASAEAAWAPEPGPADEDKPPIDWSAVTGPSVTETAPETEAVPEAEAVPETEAAVEAAPEAGAAAEPETAPEAAEPASQPTSPKWDPARRAYISYDPRRGEWLQHDTETGTWGPISRGDE